MISRSLRFIAPTLLLIALHGVAKADIIYGSTSTSLFRINTADPNVLTQQTLIANTGFNNINGLALDPVTNRLYYRAGTGGTIGNGVFRFYDLDDNAQGTITPTTAFPAPATNASFFNGNYWYVGQTTTSLVRFNPLTGVVTSFSPFAGQPNFNFFGDVAISSTGMLYGTDQTRFFRVNVASGTPTGFAVITTGTASATNQYSRQLAFGANGQTLFGYKDTSRPWATIDLVTGTTTAITPPNNLNSFADLASAQVVPEPGSIVLTLCGGGMLLGIVARRRKK